MWVKGLVLELQGRARRRSVDTFSLKGQLPTRALQLGNCPMLLSNGTSDATVRQLQWCRKDTSIHYHFQPMGWKCNEKDIWLNPGLVEQCFGTIIDKPKDRKHDVKSVPRHCALQGMHQAHQFPYQSGANQCYLNKGKGLVDPKGQPKERHGVQMDEETRSGWHVMIMLSVASRRVLALVSEWVVNHIRTNRAGSLFVIEAATT